MTTAFRLAPALLLALAACSPSADSLSADKGADESAADERVVPSDKGGDTAPEMVPDGVAITSVGELLGEYRVAGVDDAELPNGEAIALSIDGPILSFEPTCAGFVWGMEFDGEVLAIQRHGLGPRPAPGEPPPPVCTVAISAGQTALARALDAVTRAERTPSNAIRLSGNGHSVTLYSQ